MYFRKIEFHFNYKSSISNVKLKHNTHKTSANGLNRKEIGITIMIYNRE